MAQPFAMVGGIMDTLPPGARGVRLSDAPTIGVVVASFRDRALLDACLASLLPQCGAHGATLVVARATGQSEIAQLEQAYPTVRFVRAPETADVPKLRGLGLASVESDIVALTEDHCVVAPDWLSQLRAANGDVVGGAMDNAQRDRAVDWAAYFSEYGFFADGGDADPGDRPPLITGANVAYSRRVVAEVVDLAQRGEWENIVHERLAAGGSTLQFLKTAGVYQNTRSRFWDFCRDRYEHGRDYARRRITEQPHGRFKYLVGSGALPFILSTRVARAVGRDKRRPFVRALPITFAFFTAWALGEAVGYCRGPLPLQS